MNSLDELGYSYVFTSAGWFNHDMNPTLKVVNDWRGQVRAVIADPEQVEGCYGSYEREGGCLRGEKNQEGVEGWRLLSFWYWDE